MVTFPLNICRPEVRELAKKAFTGYLKALQLLPRSETDQDFISELNVEAYAKSLGLPFTPEVPIVAKGGLDGRQEVRESKNVNRKLDKLKKQIQELKEAKKRKREGEAPYDKTVSLHFSSSEGGNKDEDDLLVVKQVHNWSSTEEGTSGAIIGNAGASPKKKKLKIGPDGRAKAKGDNVPKKIIFNEDDEIIEPFTFQKIEGQGSTAIDAAKVEDYLSRVRSRVEDGRKEDLEREKNRIRAKHLEKKSSLKHPRGGDANDEVVVTLGSADAVSEEDDSYMMENRSDVGSDSEVSAEEDERDQASLNADDDRDDIEKQEQLALRLLSSRK